MQRCSLCKSNMDLNLIAFKIAHNIIGTFFIRKGQQKAKMCSWNPLQLWQMLTCIIECLSV